MSPQLFFGIVVVVGAGVAPLIALALFPLTLGKAMGGTLSAKALVAWCVFALLGASLLLARYALAPPDRIEDPVYAGLARWDPMLAAVIVAFALILMAATLLRRTFWPTDSAEACT